MESRNDILVEDARRVVGHVDISAISGKKILVAGASGLIGTHIVYSIKEFVEHTGAKTELSVIVHDKVPCHLDFINGCEWITLHRGSLTDCLFLRSLPDADIIIDAAGYGQPLRFMGEAVNTLKLNTYTIFELMDKLNEHGKFLFMSSSAVYTGLCELPFHEGLVGSSNMDHPRASYIEGKKCGEAICNSYRSEGVDAKSVRLSIVYGPGTKKGDVRVMNSFIKSGLVDREIRLLDGGKAEKAFMYVSDAVELIWKILLSGKGHTYNIGGQSKITIAQLAEKIGQYCGVPVMLGESDENAVEGAIPAEILSMEKSELEFGKHDYIGIDEGLKRTIEWQKKNLYWVA